MTIYLLLLLLIILLGIIFERKNKKLYSILVFILLTLVAGLRSYKVGTDSSVYVSGFSDILYKFEIFNWDIFSETRYENGFVLLMLAIRNITSNYTLFFLIIHCFINYSICKFIRKYSNNMCISFIIFVLLRCFFSEMNIMRQYIALAIFLLAIKYIEDKKFIKYLICILLATFIHTSAIMLLPIYFINKIEFNSKQKFKLIIASIIIYFVLYNVLASILQYMGTYEGYLNSYYDSNKIGNIVSFFLDVVIYIFITYLFSKNKSKTNNSERFLYKLLFVNLLCSFLCIKISILSRITEYFSIIPVILIPNAIEKISKNKYKWMFYFIILLVFSLYFFVIAYYRPNWNECIPYTFYWDY